MLARLTLSAAIALLVAGGLRAQHVGPFDPPKLYVPKKAPTQAEIDRREAMYRFVHGLVCQHEDRLLEALKAFEESAALDPQPAAVYRAQVPILIALERGPEAVAVCKKAIERDADDCETCAILARLHKALAQPAEARQALEKGLKSPRLEDRPELAQQMYFDLGTLYEADNQWASAAGAFLKAAVLLDHPDVIAEHVGVDKDLVTQRAAEMYERIGDLYRKAKKYDRALAAYVKAQERLPARADRLNFNLAQVCIEQGDDAKALGHLDAYLATLPLGKDGYEAKIALLRRAKRDANIVPWLEQAVKLDVNHVGLRLLLAQECNKAKQTARAEEIYRKVAETNPSIELYRGLFHIYADDPAVGMVRALALFEESLARATRKGEPDTLAVGQVRAMAAALRDDPALAHAMIASGFKAANKGTTLRFETAQLLAMLAEKNRQWAEAEKFYRGALKQLPPEMETAVYAGLIRVLAKARRFEAQIEACDGALNGDAARGLPKAQATNHILFLSEKARALAGLRRHDDAVAAADRAVQLANDNNKLLMRMLRVRLLTMANRLADAEKDCLALLEQHKLEAEVLEIRYLLSNVYSTAKQMAKAEEQLQLVLKIDPDSPAANNDLGYHWAEQGKNLEGAEKMIRKAIDIDRRQRQGLAAPGPIGEPAPPQPITPVAAKTEPDVEDNAAYIDSLGWVLYRRGRIAEARKELERAAELPDGDDPVIFEHLGDVYQKLQMPAEARRAWEQAVRLYEQGMRRIDAERYEELQRKLKSAASRGP